MSIADLLEAKRNGKTPVIGIAGDKQIAIGNYVKIVKAAKANPRATFKQTFESWAPGTGATILREFHNGVNDRINQRGGLVVPQKTQKQETRIQRRLNLARLGITVECKWCGSALPWAPDHARFCDVSCRRSYLS